MHSAQERVIAVVGAGPRGTSFLERLLSQLERGEPRDPADRRLRIIVIDPAPHGAGRVWDPDQSPLFLMNTPASFPTAAPAAATCAELPASSAAMSYADWRRSDQGRVSADESRTGRGQNLGGEADDNDYPARADYGRYLTALHGRIVEALEALDGVTVDSRRASATGLRPRRGAYEVTLDDGTWLAADSAVLSLGHVPARLNESAARIAVVAAELGLRYVPPSVPTDVDLEAIPAGENVLIRGMGLNFFDLMIGLTAGRGGTFTHDPHAPAGRRMHYTPSGREPHLIAGSRRGTPYRAKSVARGFVPEGVELVHFTDDTIAEVVSRHETVEFAAHLWPLLQRDVLRTYYRTLAHVAPELFADGPQDFLDEFDELLHASRGGEQVLNAQGRRLLSRHAPDALWFDVRAMARPFADTIFDSSAQYQEQVRSYLEDDAHSSVAGTSSPVKMAVGALHAGRIRLKALISEHTISDASLVSDVEGWFEALVEGLASG
ncbi:MAG: FAD/NAD(P)-binding protein, partial [Nesterenkonia sp.]|nr:FAD/NAD(P)-binding protein [Nesterenkonia sp.]